MNGQPARTVHGLCAYRPATVRVAAGAGCPGAGRRGGPAPDGGNRNDVRCDDDPRDYWADPQIRAKPPPPSPRYATTVRDGTCRVTRLLHLKLTVLASFPFPSPARSRGDKTG